MPKQSNSKVLSLMRRASESVDKDYSDKPEIAMSKTNRSNALKDALFTSNKELKEKVKALETQNQNLKEINTLLKEKIEKSCKSNSAVPSDPKPIDMSPKKQKASSSCSLCQMKDLKISSLVSEVEDLQLALSNACRNTSEQFYQVLSLENYIKQQEIKNDLEVSHLSTKLKLIEETLTNKNKDLKTLDSFKKNNEQLLALLERYDSKVSEMQHEIDIRDLRIKELEGVTLESEKLNLDDLEIRIKFLINLLETCRTQLEKEANKEEGEFDPNDKLDLSNDLRLERENIPEYSDRSKDSNSIVEAIREFYRNQVNCESKIETGLPSLL